MNITTLFPAVLLAASLSGSAAFGQDNSAAPAPAAAAPSVPTLINGLVYVDKLPTPTALLKDAEAEGLTIARMEQSSDRLVVVYQYPNGTTRAFAYTTTVTGAAVQAPVPAAPVSTATYRVISESPETTVVYTQPRTIYYEPRYVRYYDPVWDGWAPLAIGLGIGLSWHDGYRGSHGGHGGWRH